MTVPFLLLFHGMSVIAALMPVVQPSQADYGPGGKEYYHKSVRAQDFASAPEGYWLFEPESPVPDSANVVIFIHGYGGYNPMVYGKWIKHLVMKGNIVIYPRYQQNMISPHPDKFAANVASAIQDAIFELKKEGHVFPVVENLAIAGHSYGGVIAADLAVNFEKYKIPSPKVVMLCSPGTGRFKGGRLESYSEMPADISLLIIASSDDFVVGDEFAVKVFEEATSTEQRNLLRQFPDSHGSPPLEAHHNQTYAIDTLFDCGIRNFTSRRALRMSRKDAVDYNGYWKLLDAMLDCQRSGRNCHVAFGGTPEQTSLGIWSDGTPVRPLEVRLPEH